VKPDGRSCILQLFWVTDFNGTFSIYLEWKTS